MEEQRVNPLSLMLQRAKKNPPVGGFKIILSNKVNVVCVAYNADQFYVHFLPGCPYGP